MRKEERKRKEAQIRRLKKKAELGSSEIAKRLGILEACNTVKKGLRQLKRKSQKRTQETEDGHVFLKYQITQQEKKKKLGATSHSASGCTSGNQNEEV